MEGCGCRGECGGWSGVKGDWWCSGQAEYSGPQMMWRSLWNVLGDRDLRDRIRIYLSGSIQETFVLQQLRDIESISGYEDLIRGDYLHLQMRLLSHIIIY